MYAIRIGKTAYGTQNENSANRHAVDFQLWNIDRNAGADNIVRKIDEKIDINGIVWDRVFRSRHCSGLFNTFAAQS